VVTLDLGGHGESSADRPVWTVPGLGQDVVAVADALKLDQMILVGHSMGGPVSLAAAGAMPGRVLGVIGADTLHDASIEYTGAQVGQAMAAFQADWAGSISGMFAGMSGPAMKPVLRVWIVAKAIMANAEVGVALFGEYARMDVPGLLAGARVPVRVINAAAGGMVPETRVELNRQYADFDAVIMEGVGHFLQLEAPQAFNTALAAVIQEIEADG
jgi:pimeloyl-ACP methyl ester carboxylesterase